MDLKTVIDEVGSWSVEDRLRLIEEVWDSVAAAPEAVVLTETQKQDLGRRLDLYRDNPKAGALWDEVKARLQGGAR
jgi:putative addiction module component (TIGR02574 family)